jgi:U4/U6 small nuclear ribonucleoprotein PRP3
MRKQRRQAELQDKRDRIRMGLIPPDPPKGMFCLFVSIIP